MTYLNGSGMLEPVCLTTPPWIGVACKFITRQLIVNNLPESSYKVEMKGSMRQGFRTFGLQWVVDPAVAGRFCMVGLQYVDVLS
jgi:hypothetical protein